MDRFCQPLGNLLSKEAEALILELASTYVAGRIVRMQSLNIRFARAVFVCFHMPVIVSDSSLWRGYTSSWADCAVPAQH